VIGRQLLRSATSVGANAHEAQAAQSRADFIAKMSIAHKEARESSYWLRLIDEAALVPTEKISGLRDEADQLVRILSSILVSSKARSAKSESKYPMARESEISQDGYEYILHS
jgi:four helix bundle protein